MIETLRRRFEVPLPDHRGLVSRLPQQLRKGLLIPVKRVPVAHEPVLVTVLPRLNHRPARPANRVGHVAPREPHPPFAMRSRFGVDIRVDVIGAQGLLAVVIGEDEENVGLLCLPGMSKANSENEYEKRFSEKSCRMVYTWDEFGCNLERSRICGADAAKMSGKTETQKIRLLTALHTSDFSSPT